MKKSRSWVSIFFESPRASIIGGWALYSILFTIGYPLYGNIVAAFVLIPILTSAVAGGPGWGLITAMVSFSANSLMYVVAGAPPIAISAHIPGNIIVVIFALQFSWLGNETRKRRRSELELANLNQNLDQEVRRRAKQLVRTQNRLKREQRGRQYAEGKASYRQAILATMSSIGEASLQADSWTSTIGETLADLGKVAGVDRVYLFKNSTGANGEILTSNLYEWAADGIESHLNDPKLQNFDFRQQGFDRWVEELSQGKPISGVVEQLPESERRFFKAQGLQAILIAPIFAGADWWGQIGLDSVRKPRIWSTAEVAALNSAASILGAGILREEDYERALLGWSKALELRDEETEGHTRRVTQMTVEIAREIGYSGQELVDIRRGALLHDIGKLGVPDRVLLKPGPLNEEEWDLMRRHPTFARDMLTPIVFLNSAITIPYYHHERWDGSGYPEGLKGDAIPRSARIFAVVDVWDALLSDRPYRDAWPADKVMAHLRENSNILFDPEIVENFVEMVREK